MKKLLFLTIFFSLVTVYAEETYNAPKLEFKMKSPGQAHVKKSEWDNDYKVDDLTESEREIASDNDEYGDYSDDQTRGPSSKKDKKRSPQSKKEEVKKFRPKTWEYKSKY